MTITPRPLATLDRLFSSGTVDEVIVNWTEVLIDGVPDRASEATITVDALAIIGDVDTAR
ncbi:MAG: hypothetical protein AAFP84_09710 [Actinomycetota bacterium]